MNKKFLLTVGITILFLGLSIQPSLASVQPDSNDMSYVDEHSSIEVTITEPESGIYRNNNKILPFFIPLVLCGAIAIEAEVVPYDEWDRMEIYINGVLQETVFGPGPVYEFAPLSWSPFLKIKFGIAVYTFDGNHASDEITIWRIFR